MDYPHNKTIHLMSGISGSGKTYYLENCIGEDCFNRILHRDDVREQLRQYYGKPLDYFPTSAKEEYKAWIAACASVIVAHPNAQHYWFDQTTLTDAAALKFYNALAADLEHIGIDITDYIFQIDIMDTDTEICIERNASRNGIERVPDKTMQDMIALFGIGIDGNRIAKKIKQTQIQRQRIVIHTIIGDEYVRIQQNTE